MDDFESEKENLSFQVERRDVRALIKDIFGESRLFNHEEELEKEVLFSSTSQREHRKITAH